MKYLEELNGGSIFHYEGKNYILTSDFKYAPPKIDKKKCISLDNGFTHWFDSNTTVDYLDLYYRDIDGNILPIKILEKNN